MLDFSLAISTRFHPQALEACLKSLAGSLKRPERVEVLLGIDHLHNIFYLLGRIGFERIIRIPEICFINDYGRQATGAAVDIAPYGAAFIEDPRRDQELFINSVALRRSLALQLARAIDPAG